MVKSLAGHAHRVNTLGFKTDYVVRTGCYAVENPPEARLDLATVGKYHKTNATA